MTKKTAVFIVLFLLIFFLSFQSKAEGTTVVAAPSSISFQNGVLPAATYTGETDTYISEYYPDTNFGTRVSLSADGDDPKDTGMDTRALLRWDISSIPVGSVVESATITLRVTDPTDGAYSFWGLKRPWAAEQATWNIAQAGVSWQTPGAAGSDDYGPYILGSMAPASTASYSVSLNPSGVDLVQSWVDNPAANYGLLVSDGDNTGGTAFQSSESATASYRPKLNITYRAPGAASPTATKTSPKVTAPKNVILMIGDGMGFASVEAAGMYANGEPGTLSFEQFPYQGEVTNYSASGPLTDSAGASTAMATGKKVYTGVISVALPGNGAELRTVLEELRNAGKRTGLVTTAFMTDATPAGFAAHEKDRNNTAQIAGDYIKQTRPNLLLGGGGSGLTPSLAVSGGYTVVTDRFKLQSLNLNRVDRVVGVFGNGLMNQEINGVGNQPHLSEMTSAALDMLEEDQDGFFLMVESGNIDDAAETNDLPKQIAETLEFSHTVEVVREWMNQHPDTLLIVTADHETGGLHVIQNNGKGNYPTVTWAGKVHTGANVPIYAMGRNADQVCGVIDNTEIRSIIYGTRVGKCPILPTRTPTLTATVTPTHTVTPTMTLTPTITLTRTPTPKRFPLYVPQIILEWMNQ